MSIDVMKQALEALEEASNVLTWDGFGKAADALRAAIEQAQEPVFNCPRCGHCCPETSQEPLTDKQIGDCVVVDDEGFIKPLAFARAIEAAHGIKGEK